MTNDDVTTDNLHIFSSSDDVLSRAAAALAEGKLVAFPTETVYGLGANACDDRAVAAIFAAKNRPRFNPLIAHVADLISAEVLVTFNERARILARAFWPGPLTMVLPRTAESPLSFLTSAGLSTAAVRIPDHPVALALLRAVGMPLAAPSANPSGAVSPTTAQHVADMLGDRVAMILDGGACRVGVESTVIDLSGSQPVLLRPGGVSRSELESMIGPIGSHNSQENVAVMAPGMLSSHYAPRLAVRLNATSFIPGEAVLGFGSEAGAHLNLSPAGDVTEAAANLFAMLRALDRPEFTRIAVMPVPETGLGEAINDRLRRAAAPRPARCCRQEKT